jgi:phospholipid-binding lipoprotein MlaA
MKIAQPATLFLALVLSACSTPSAESLAQNDPWEATNRDVFAFDVWVDHNIARPVTQGYRVVVPEPARDGVHNMLTNLHSPVVLANDVLQGDGRKAVRTLGRIVINSTIGIGGIFDVAAKIGIPYHDNDFGITMGQGGIWEGSYLVLPILGPRPPRDLIGGFVDGAFDPLTYAHFPGRHELLTVRTPVSFLDFEDRHMDEVQTIERSSIDFYATTRNLYRQHRDAQIRGVEFSNMNLPDL